MGKQEKANKGRTSREDDALKLEALEVEWRKIGLTGPARKALVEAKLYKVSDLRKITLSELVSLPGVSKSAIARIKVIMAAKGIRFRQV